MIDPTTYAALVADHPGLGTLDAKTAEIARDELDPSEQVSAVEAVTIEGKAGVVVLTDKRVVAFWKMTMLFFFKLPTVQQFHLSQLTHVELDGGALRLRAVADPKDPDAGWEDNRFVFAQAEAAKRFHSAVQASRGTVADGA